LHESEVPQIFGDLHERTVHRTARQNDAVAPSVPSRS
jgi:hypothetical protein